MNHYWRARRQGGRYISQEGQIFRVATAAAVRPLIRKPLAGRLDVHVAVFPPDRRKRDLDNLSKATLDALEKAGAFHDDEQIDRLCFERCEVAPPGRLVVTIRSKEGDTCRRQPRRRTKST